MTPQTESAIDGIEWRVRRAQDRDIPIFCVQKHKKLHFLVKQEEAEKSHLQRRSEYLKMAPEKHELSARVYRESQ